MNYYGVYYTHGSRELYHFGVAGMKWGVRKDKGGSKKTSVRKPVARRTDDDRLRTGVTTGRIAGKVAGVVIGCKCANRVMRSMGEKGINDPFIRHLAYSATVSTIAEASSIAGAFAGGGSAVMVNKYLEKHGKSN